MLSKAVKSSIRHAQMCDANFFGGNSNIKPQYYNDSYGGRQHYRCHVTKLRGANGIPARYLLVHFVLKILINM